MAYQSCRIKRDDANALVDNPCVITYLTARRLWHPSEIRCICNLLVRSEHGQVWRWLATEQVARHSRGGQFYYVVF
jgi:hypothetical protein